MGAEREAGAAKPTTIVDYPSRWVVRCPSCSRRQAIELPYGERAGLTGVRPCPVGHPFSYRYDGVTVVVSLHFAAAPRALRPV